jgi:hypothetical protein
MDGCAVLGRLALERDWRFDAGLLARLVRCQRARADELPRAVPTTLSSSGLRADRQDFARRDLNGERNLPAPRRMAVRVLTPTTRRPRKRPGSHPGLVYAKTVAGGGRQGKPV